MVKLLKLSGVIRLMWTFLIGTILITTINIQGVYYAMIYNESLSKWTRNPFALIGGDIKTAIVEIWYY